MKNSNNTTTINNSVTIAKAANLTADMYDIINSMSIEQLKELRKDVSTTIRQHSDYVAPTKKLHLQAKKVALDIIMNKVFGLNGAMKETKKLLSDGTLNIASYTTKEVHEVQLTFALKSLKNVKLFMSQDEQALEAFTPKLILDTLIKAATMKPENFAKRVK